MNTTLPTVGAEYEWTHPRAGNFVGVVERIITQDIPHGGAHYTPYTWVTIRLTAGVGRRLGSTEVIQPGDTIDLLVDNTRYHRNPRVHRGLRVV